ncbi:nuclear pore complex protein Nup153 isoform X4 [Dermochelys coriacea]|uniref:nuclear pore complex protein Nup153 isoform X4 n=1 Tax=Dermochelys coriacea TaxID=27794 RepID=UPI0018E8FF38|nr:nuclear pore complex protein Nup153 isoform X4 [Dermochelys coriacea]
MASGGGGGGGGGGTGGGKIRTRRYHLGASKPYPRNKQQGIISRVTESVKNIVPGWLQRYFNKSEDECVDASEPVSQQETPVNYHHGYSDDHTPVFDGRVTPESTRINLEEPSTSRSALNFSDVLTRPSLHRGHLNCTMLDSPSPHCQPSTSSAFAIGSSGLSLVKEIKDSTSQHDDDNISTTSGFSSRASDKDIAISKNTSVPPLWSTEAERSHSLTQHSATSSKKPAFNLSAFGTLSPSLGNASVLKASQLGDSPFYPGKTTYGGAAAAARQSKIRITPYQPVDRSMLDITRFHSKRKQVESQHPPVQKLVTAKTISQSMSRLQYFKPSLTPAAESGKIRQRVDVKHKGVREKNLTAEQQVEPPESNFTYPKFSTPASNGLYSGVGGGGGGKMRRERGVHYVSQPGQEKQEAEAPVLPKIPLPINTISLPNFSFGSLASTNVSSSPITNTQPVINKVQPASNASSPVFRFSSPIVKSTEAEVLPPLSIGFTFSVPVVKSTQASGSSDTPVPLLISPGTTAVNSTSNKRKEKEEYDGAFKPAKVLKEGSVLDILKSPDFTSLKTHAPTDTQPVSTSTEVYTRPAISNFSAGSLGFRETCKQASSYWRCDTCLLQNKATDNKCVTCQAAKVLTADPAKQSGMLTLSSTVKSTAPATGTPGFGDKFKTAAGTWDCDTCLVQNKPEATKCVACETPKPGTGVKPALTLPVVTENTTVTSSPSCTETTVTLGFGDKFKKPKGSWDCTVCLVSNKAEDSKCVACQCERPGGSVPVTSSSTSSFSTPSGGFLGLDKFKKPEGSWDCEICLVQNKAEATKCIACENAKPGTKPELKGFGTAAVSSDAAAPSFKFGIQSSSSESSQTLGNTESFKFGEQGGLKFGITSESGSVTNNMTVGFNFSKTSGDFKFGVSSSDSKSEESKKDSKNNNFNFGLPSGTSNPSTSAFQFGTSNLGQQEKKEEPVLGGFSFGTSSTASIATSENKAGVSGFSFGTVAEKEVAATPFLFKKSEEKKDETPSAKGGFSFGSMEPASASQFVSGKTEEKQDSVTSATSLVFRKTVDNEEPKVQSIFSFGKSEQTKEESTAKPTFSFNLTKPEEKETEQTKPAFTFGAQTNTADQGAAKPAFGFLSSGSSSTAIPCTSANSSSVFGSSSSASNPPPVATAFLFGQASNSVSSSAFGNASESSATQSFGFSQENKPATTSSSTGAAVGSFLFGSGTSSNNTATPGFNFGATTTSSSTGSSSSFVFGSGSSAPAAGPAFGASQTPTFGQSQGASQPNAPTFGSLSSTSLFSAGSQPAPPAFGSVSSSSQPPVFGQQASQQPGFGSGTTPNSSAVFQFGSSNNFSFTSSNPGVFNFGAPAPPTQPSGSSGFPFNPTPSFAMGSNGKNMFSASGSSVSGRKIKTAVRRRK